MASWKVIKAGSAAHSVSSNGHHALCGASPRSGEEWQDPPLNTACCPTCEQNSKPHPAFDKLMGD